MSTSAPQTRTVCQLTGTIARTGYTPEGFFRALRRANDQLEAVAQAQREQAGQ